ncbi:MAG TPA: S-methyl-5-thioribose-1-phosphate isomerase [Armatimonadota bacterium]|jgi:methylthioribose-1-phosphate isomerase
MTTIPPTVTWLAAPDGPAVRMIDQTRLPGELVMLDCRTIEQLCEAIVSLRVRGAPAIGCAAALGLSLAAHLSPAETVEALLADLESARALLAATRPTAVNLFWALDRVMDIARFSSLIDAARMRDRILHEAREIVAEDVDRCRRIGLAGAPLLPAEGRVLTHCNAGALATGGYGTALGVIRAGVEAGKKLHVWADETRPLLQGARLTAWEMHAEGIPCTVLCDNAAAVLMAQGQVDCVIVGADRIAANGDTANKIGTYGVAVLAQAHGVPFYVAAPLSTLDAHTATGAEIPIEQRPETEVSLVAGRLTEPITPAGVPCYNPAFDVTPAALVTAIITEKGVLRPPYEQSIAEVLRPPEFDG